MANVNDRLPRNVPGRFYVDSSCIDCDQCRIEAPDFFVRDDDAGTSILVKQPTSAEEVELLEKIATDCSTNSIGNDGA